MPSFSETAQALFRPYEGPLEFGLEFSIETHGAPLPQSDFATAIYRIGQCFHATRGAQEFVWWIIEGRPKLDGGVEHFTRFEQWVNSLRDDPLITSPFYEPAHVLADGAKLLAGIALTHNHFAFKHDVFSFYFVGSYHKNPWNFRYLSRGTMFATLMSVTIFGTIQIHKDFTAGECRASYKDLIQYEQNFYEQQSKLQGRYSDQLQKSHDETLGSLIAASAACGSPVADFGVRLEIAPSTSFEIRFGPTHAEAKDPPQKHH